MSSHSIDAIIAGNLHLTLLYLYLAGAYLGLYFTTINTYWYKTSQNRLLVVGALTALLITVVGEIGLQWHYLVTVIKQPTKVDMYYSILSGSSGPASTHILNIILSTSGSIVADGLMTWRCFNIYGRSIVKISLLIFLFTAEVGLGISVIVIDGLLTALPEYATEHTIWQYDIIFGTSYSVTAATSTLATLIIAYRIHVLTSNAIKQRQKYAYIVEIIVQSVSVYTAFTLGQATCFFVGANDSTINHSLYIAISFFTALGVIASAAAPTLMVARLSSSQEDLSPMVNSASNSSNLTALQEELNIIGADQDSGIAEGNSNA